MRPQQGLTLPETLLAMTLLGLVLSLVYPVLTGTTKAMLRAEADTQSQQQAVLLVEKVFSDFAFSTRASLTVVQSVPAASFLSREAMRYPSLPPLVQDTDYFPSSGSTFPTTWNKFVALRYRSDPGQLERMEFPYTGGSSLACLTPEQLVRLLDDPQYASTRKVAVTGISSFSMQATGDSSLLLRFTSKQRFDVERTTNIQVILSMRN